MKTKINSSVVIGLSFLALFITYGLYWRLALNRITEDPGFTLGHVTYLGHHVGKSAASGKYQYSVGDRSFVGSFSRYILCDNSTTLEQFEGKIFKVVYHKSKPQYSRLLVSKDLYEEYGLLFTTNDSIALGQLFCIDG